MSKTNRRNFVKASAVAAGAAATMSFPTLVLGQRGANERIRVGLVGLGGRMQSHVGSLAAMAQSDNVEIAAICDCDQSKLDSAAEKYAGLANLKLKTYTDQRALFDDKSIDAISFSTQDHWHALQTIWACQAGKHVYVEKPPTWCIWEGRKMVEAARKYGCMVQVGTQNRSSPNVREGMQKLQEGVIGKLYMARAMSYKLRGNLGKHKPVPVPAGLNWEGWVGPAKMVEYSDFHHHRWYWIENFASGDAANQLVHDVDKVRWGLGLQDHPVTVMCMGDRYAPGDTDDADTPNTLSFLCKWADNNALVTVENRHWYTNSEAQMRDKYPFVAENQCVGEIFFGSEGYMIFPDYVSYYTFLGPKNEPGPFKTASADFVWTNESVPHFQNWMAAMRSGKHEDLNADIEEGHKSATVCHLAKISAKLGRSVHFDPQTERFVNDPEADKFLKREYRPPYVIPEQV
ncbi:MAG: Gfo/Idh/MocA family protein [Pirellulaceae bacterium]